MSETMEAPSNIAVLVETTPVIVLQDIKKRDALFAHIQQEIAAFEYDLTTDKGRKAVGSLAYKVARTKTAIDDAGKALIEDAQKLVRSTNEERKAVRDKLDALRDQARKPLDDWENAEKARIDRCNALTIQLKQDAQVSFDDTSDTVGQRLAVLGDMVVDRDQLGDFFDIVTDAHSAAVKTLTDAKARILREEADRAELQRLRDEAAERDRLAAEAAAAQEAEARRVEDERLAEERRVQAEADTQRRADKAVAAAREESERLATEALAASDRAHAAELQRAEQEKADLIAVQQREAANRVAEEKRVADEAAARAADREHRAVVMGAAKEALMAEGGIGEDRAKKIVLAIAAGSIPHITINF